MIKTFIMPPVIYTAKEPRGKAEEKIIPVKCGRIVVETGLEALSAHPPVLRTSRSPIENKASTIQTLLLSAHCKFDPK